MASFRSRRSLVAPSLLLALASLCASGSSSAAPVLRWQGDLRGDVRVFGNTLAHDCGAAISLPPDATASCDGQQNTDDFAPDIYWRDNQADTSIEPTQARTSATLELPSGAKVKYARLYWGALKQGSEPDKEVTLDWLNGPSTTIAADDSWSIQFEFSSHPDWYYYQATGDATKFVADWGKGDFRVTDVDAIPLANVNVDRFYSAWTLVVFYEQTSEPLRNLALFDGLERISPNTGVPKAEVTLSGFLVPQGYDAKMAAFVYEGDKNYDGDHFTINGVKVGDAQSPTENFFNSSRSFMGQPVSGWADVPALSGEPGSMSSYDLDFVDIKASVKPGDTQATVAADSALDFFLLGGFVTSITNKVPEFELIKTAFDVNGGAVLPEDEIEFTISGINVGNDTAVDAVLTDVLDVGFDFIPGSLEIVSGANSGNKTDKSGDDQAEYNDASRTITFRLGTGADSSSGGTIAEGESFEVKFKAKILVEAGSVSNQAKLKASGEAGGNEKTWDSDGDPTQVGTQVTTVTVKECQDDSQCSDLKKPHCDLVTQTCQPCKTDNDCSNPAIGACQADGSCNECSKTNDTACKDPKPVCNFALGTCQPCSPGADGDATKCAGNPGGEKCVTTPDNQNKCGCETDADCGGPKSGKVCDTVKTQQCIDGCRGQGGNGCPDTLDCTSKDTTIGKCVMGAEPEDTDMACSDGKDNDLDGKIDCADSDCNANPKVTVCSEKTDDKCKDGKDNDNDGQTDCDDSDCANTPGITVCGENSVAHCQDGHDNDGDGKTDCDDPDCIANSGVCGENNDAACSNGKDDDGDGKIDCDDSDCKGSENVTVCSAENDDPTCSNGKDDDGDGLIDCQDVNCSQNPNVTVCGKPENNDAACSDKTDNDKDGKIDCDDTDCSKNPTVSVCGEKTDPECSDKQDNDGDGKIDCDDVGCSKSPEVTVCGENNDAVCGDGQDNDGDGLVDCADPGCKNNPAVTVCKENTDKTCSDGLDNDGDGKIDCQDDSCNVETVKVCGPENTKTKCSDGIDNDGDGKTDCKDDDCANLPVCGGTGTFAEPESQLADQDGGCGCRVPGGAPTSSSSPALLLLALGALGLVSRRRRA